jgi:hypothetical protein
VTGQRHLALSRSARGQQSGTAENPRQDLPAGGGNVQHDQQGGGDRCQELAQQPAQRLDTAGRGGHHHDVPAAGRCHVRSCLRLPPHMSTIPPVRRISMMRAEYSLRSGAIFAGLLPVRGGPLPVSLYLALAGIGAAREGGRPGRGHWRREDASAPCAGLLRAPASWPSWPAPRPSRPGSWSTPRLCGSPGREDRVWPTAACSAHADRGFSRQVQRTAASSWRRAHESGQCRPRTGYLTIRRIPHRPKAPYPAGQRFRPGRRLGDPGRPR